MNLIENPNIWAKVICDSISANSGNRITTFEIQLPRFILAELNTHGMLKKNTQSSRAVPIQSMLDLYHEDYYIPTGFGRNKSGMSSTEYLMGEEDERAVALWQQAELSIRDIVMELGNKDGLNIHKQWVARLYEPFMFVKLVITATEWDNFFWLRDDLDAAQPEMVDLARKMKIARENSTPNALLAGMWHMPYVDSAMIDSGDYIEQVFFDASGKKIDIDTALMISSSCAAQMSYRKADDSIEKAQLIYDRLFGGAKPHMSPTEHQGRVMIQPMHTARATPYFEVGASHLDRDFNYWSGNLKGFIQYRKLIEQGKM